MLVRLLSAFVVQSMFIAEHSMEGAGQREAAVWAHPLLPQPVGSSTTAGDRGAEGSAHSVRTLPFRPHRKRGAHVEWR
jgi:hypothetical protein